MAARTTTSCTTPRSTCSIRMRSGSRYRPRPHDPKTIAADYLRIRQRLLAAHRTRRMTSPRLGVAVATPDPEESARPPSSIAPRGRGGAWLKRPLRAGSPRTYGVDLRRPRTPISTATPPSTSSSRASSRPAHGRSRATRDARRSGRRHADASTARSTAAGCIQAKGSTYTLAELLGETGADVAALDGGRYFTIYLAPHNYHRVHAPLAGSPDAHALHSRRALQRQPRDGRGDLPPVLPQRARRLLVRDASTARWPSSSSAH